jgi:hypothetical protein
MIIINKISIFFLENTMSLERVMVDSATGASPPRSLTNDMACSPIRFLSSIQSTSTSGRGFYSSSNFLNQEDNKIRENIVMRKYVVFIIIFRQFVVNERSLKQNVKRSFD